MAVPVPVVSLGEYEELKAEVSNTFERAKTQGTSPTHPTLCAGCVPNRPKVIYCKVDAFTVS